MTWMCYELVCVQVRKQQLPSNLGIWKHLKVQYVRLDIQNRTEMIVSVVRWKRRLK